MDITGRDGAEVSAVLVLMMDALLLEDFEVSRVVEVEFEVPEVAGVLVAEVSEADDVLEGPVIEAESGPFPVEVGLELPPVLVIGISPPSYALELGREQEPSRFWLIVQEPV